MIKKVMETSTNRNDGRMEEWDSVKFSNIPTFHYSTWFGGRVMRWVLTLTTVAGMLLLFNSDISAQCKVKGIVKNCMPALSPYQYDSYAVKEITYSEEAKKEILEFSVYSGEQYKLVFGKTILPQEIGINIYDRDPGRKDKKLLYFDESGKKDNLVCNFEPTYTGTYFIEYDIPAATAPNQKGCFVVIIGIID